MNEGESIMDHDTVVRQRMTEKYLLEELDPQVRDEFEEHYFDCQECARDVRAGSEFVIQSRIVLAQRPDPISAHATAPVRQQPGREWFAWLRPAFAVPAMALLLVVIGYQNLVTFPQLTRGVNQPQVLAATTVNLLTYGGNGSPLVVHRGEGFLLNIIIPPGHGYAAYRVDLHSPAGGVESVPIPASADDTWPIRFPGASRQSGNYKLSVHGITPSGQDIEVGSGSFQLQVRE
jgi:hypothetical protein